MKMILVGILVSFGLVGQSQAQFAEQIDIPFTRYVLDNGLTLLVHEDHKAPIVAVNVWYHVGSKDEHPGITGFAHLFEHLMFNGSENFDGEWFAPLQGAGGTDANGTTNADRTNYFQTVPTPALDMILWMESDRMGHLLGAITQEKLDEQRSVVQNEMRQNYESAPYGRAWFLELAGLFPEGHPYRWPTIGSMDDLNAASLEDVNAWFENYYGAANAVLTIAGDVDPEDVLERVQHYFGDIAPGPAVSRPEVWIAQHTESRRDVMQDDVPQARLTKAWNTPPFGDSESVLLEVASAVLADGRNSRFYKRLVYEDQIATSVNASQYTFEIAGIFEIEAYVKPGVELATVEQAINEELQRFLGDGPTRDELERVKTAYFASIMRSLEKVGGFGGKAQLLAQFETYTGDADDYREDLINYEQATARQVRDAARKWLSNGDYNLEVHPQPRYSVSETGADRSQLPDPGEVPQLHFPEIQQFQLNNGMPVLLANYGALPVVNMSMVFEAGYAADFSGKPGAAAFTGAMLQEGAGSLDSLEISDREERLGAQISASSRLDITTVSLSALLANLDDSVDLYAEIIRNPSFPADELERVRSNWMDRIAREKNDPQSMAYRALPPLLYGDDHPYGIPFTGSGTEASAQSMQREDLMAFHDTWMQPDNAILILVGPTTREEVEPVLNRYFGNWQASDQERPEIELAIQQSPVEGGKIYLLHRPGGTQSMIIGGQLLPSSEASSAQAMDMSTRILGGTFNSRLNMNLREDKGWAYGARLTPSNARGERPLIYYAPVQSDKTVDSLREIMRETAEYLDENPATGEELDFNREAMLRSLPGSYETAGAVMDTIEDMIRFRRPFDFVETSQEDLRSMTIDQVHSVANENIDLDRTIWLVVGDLAEIEAPLRASNLGEVIVLEP